MKPSQSFAIFLWFGFVPTCYAQIDSFAGYADAVRRAAVATTENGVVAEVMVKEGDFVEQGQPILRLDDAVHKTHLKIAQHEAQNTSEIQAQESRVKLLGFAVAKLRELVASGSARPLELEREEAEWSMAKAILEEKRHDYQTKQLQLERLRTELEKRTIRAPFAGHIAKLPRQVGEFISSNSSEVAILIDATTLQADFALPFAMSKGFREGQSVELLVDGQTVRSEVTLVGLVVDRSSQTVNVRVAIDNANLAFKPGTDCLLVPAGTGPQVLQTSTQIQP
ncbi:MAG: efflux RND transporter periplasmic adaptor subunit [Planctomycetaceae bacterium]|nr:efflux RND transporter periplasmic adaptor subunit [Planctomycetaceae bacterium]